MPISRGGGGFGPPAAPAIVRNFLWDAPSTGGSPTGYRIYWGTSTGVHASGPHEDTGTPLQELYTALGLAADTTYYVIARAYNGDGESGNSNEIQVRNGVQIGP